MGKAPVSKCTYCGKEADHRQLWFSGSFSPEPVCEKCHQSVWRTGRIDPNDLPSNTISTVGELEMATYRILKTRARRKEEEEFPAIEFVINSSKS